MDTSILSGLSAGGLGGVVVAVVYVLYKCFQGKKVQSKCCGGEITVASDAPSAPPPLPQLIEISASAIPTRHNTPVMTGATAPAERRMSVLQVV